MKTISHLFFALAVMAFSVIATSLKAQVLVSPNATGVCQLSSLDLTKVTYFNDNGKNSVQADKATFGTPLVIGGVTYKSGVGTHASSKFVVKLNGATGFRAIFGIDDEAPNKADHGIVDYTVVAYSPDKTSTTLAEGTVKRSNNRGDTVDVALNDAVYLVIDFDKGAQAWGDHVDIVNAYFTYDGQAPVLVTENMMWKNVSEVVDIPTAPNGLEYIPLSSLDLSKTSCGWGTPKQNQSIDGNALIIDGTAYSSGVGTHSPSQIIVKLNGSVTEFHAVLGIDDEVTSYGNFDYRVYLKAEDGTVKDVASGTIDRTGIKSADIHVDVNGWKYLYLETSNGLNDNWGDHVDWANAYFVFQDQNSTRPCIVSAEDISSKLACATMVFSQPNVRFMHKIRSVNPEAVLSVSGLPDGLEWNAKRNIVEGIVSQNGHYVYHVNISANGETTVEDVSLTVSDSLEHPVPFMGWLSWNSVQDEVSEDIVRQVVDLFLEKGLYDCGWNTVMLDDWWHAKSRAADGSPQADAIRFPNGIDAVSAYVHGKGMKFGIYTDAAETTCAGAFGSYGKETVDAQAYAKWKVDVVKCDYCNAPSDVETAKTRYKTLADAFKAANYGTMLYICEWGVREPWKWGAEVGGRCWRVSQDVRDCWTGSGTGVGVVQSIRDMKNLSAYQGVNRFNDADMLCTALHGKGKSSNDLCGGTGPGMTQDEYRTQFALWCMWSSPMALSFDPRSKYITDDDYAIMKSTELIALNQDRMGQQADLISEDNDLVIFAKDCENGDVALSVTNMSSTTKTAVFNFDAIPSLTADKTYAVRDLWERKDLGDATEKLSTRVRPHATKVFRLAEKTDTTAVKSLDSENEITVTPEIGKIIVSAPFVDGMKKRVLVCDMDGRIVKSLSSDSGKIDVPMPDGAYVVTVACNAQVIVRKVIV